MTEDILNQVAHDRAVAEGLPYSGAFTPTEAKNFLDSSKGAVLVDVRTNAELNYVGRIPDSIEIEWLDFPGMKVNTEFFKELEKAGVTKDQPVLFICRSGVRSHNAALAAQAEGFHQVYNVIEGFEGDPDENSQRNKVNGWRYHGLPWYQA